VTKRLVWKKDTGKMKTTAKLKRGGQSTHGMSGTPIYGVWMAMKYRCFNPKCKEFKNYGGRGITVCDRWMEFKSFRDDMLSTYQSGLQLDRIDNDGNYEPSNCRWVTRSQNGKNKQHKASKQSKYDGVIWHADKWQASVRFRTHSEEEAFFIYTKLNDYLKSLI